MDKQGQDGKADQGQDRLTRTIGGVSAAKGIEAREIMGLRGPLDMSRPGSRANG